MLTAWTKQFVKRAARRAGYQIARSDESSTMETALDRIAANQRVATIVDVGASDGRWSRLAMGSFPSASYLVIEAQAEHHRDALASWSKGNPRVHVVLAVAGDGNGHIHFDTSDPFGGAASHEAFDTGDATLQMTTVDAEASRYDLEGPFLIKLDTHGFERQILSGAGTTLLETQALIIEAYNFTLRPGAMRFPELCMHMESLGFLPVDIVNSMRRPSDGVLWQFDLVFARADSKAFAVTRYA